MQDLTVDDNGALTAIAWRNSQTGETGHCSLRHLFLFIGADPCTDWMAGCNAAIDAKGFVLTGRPARPHEDDPLGLHTSLDGVFAIGDVRSGSTKRVAAAVGEGAAVVAQIHGYLGGLLNPLPEPKPKPEGVHA